MKLKLLLIAIGVVLTTSIQAKELDPRFIKAIHMVESGGRIGKIVGDNGKALGPLQIHRIYFDEAVRHDPSLGKDNYNSVTNLAFATRVMTVVLNAQAPNAVKTKNFEVLARIHNGGPMGYKKSATLSYWKRVEKHLT